MTTSKLILVKIASLETKEMILSQALGLLVPQKYMEGLATIRYKFVEVTQNQEMTFLERKATTLLLEDKVLTISLVVQVMIS